MKRMIPGGGASGRVVGLVVAGVVVGTIALVVGLQSVARGRQPVAAPTAAVAEPPPAAADTPSPLAATTAAAPAATTPAETAASSAAPAVAAAPTSQPVGDSVSFEVKPAPDAVPGAPNPLFGPNFSPDDGLPRFICATDAFASYLTLLQLQAGGYDVKHGFHLGLVPYELNEQEYSIPQEAAESYIEKGEWDCTLNTVDGVARTSHAVITGIVDESAGGDGMWARDVASIYDLKGKRIAYSVDSSADFFMRYALEVAQLGAGDVTLVPFDTIDEAVAAFNRGEADVVSAWEPQLSQAAESGGRPLVTSDSLRIIIDAILVSKKSIDDRPDVVQAFHDAWFDAIKSQTEDFETAARQVAAWGNNAWSAVSEENAVADFRDQLKLIAQADLQDNLQVMANLDPIVNQIGVSRRVWSAVQEVPDDDARTLIDPRFVLRSAAREDLASAAKPVNDTFSLGGGARSAAAPPAAAEVAPQVVAPAAATAVTTDEQATLAVLPCRKFTFLPNSAVLTQESRRVLDLCVVPVLQQRAGLYLLVRGSAAWPGPSGAYSEGTIREFARARAQAVADYLASQEIDPERLVIEGVVPPEGRRQTDDPVLQAEDRFVEMSLIAGGL